MATTEEKQELVDTLSGPRFYRVLIQGYGGESAYMTISKEAYDFWKEITDEHGDSDLVNYMLNVGDGECDFDNIDELPDEADFLKDDDHHRSWYDSPTEFEHTYGAEYSSAHLTVEEVESEEFSTNRIAEVISATDITELNDSIGSETEGAVDLVKMDCCSQSPEGYIAQMYSSEKGCFFDGLIETHGEFDIKKLKIHTTEYLNGEDTITLVTYDGVEVDNFGGDTIGKGFYASVWLE